MKSQFYRLGGIIIALLVVALFLNTVKKPDKSGNVGIPTPTPQPIPPAATLEIFSGNVTLYLPGSDDPVVAVSGELITAGTRIATGQNSRAQLFFPNKSAVRLDDNTEITLRKFTEDPFEVDIALSKRRIWARAAKLLGNESMTTTTPTVIAAVRGTSYGIGILPDGRNRIITTRGKVDTRCINDTQNATVTVGKKIILDCTSGGTLPLLSLDEVMKDRDEWFEFNLEKDKGLGELYGQETYDDDTD